ncbi:MAG: FG-GAP-like repeat-containing protein [Opitutaceae bacterium]|nr:FG-GAP-like repeat-containing protein [Opitutaceae bacterium]
MPQPFRLLALSFAFSIAHTLSAQSVPPAQDHVAAIGSAPLRAPATADFAPGAFFTLEGWFYLTGNTPFGWLAGKGLAASGVDPFLSFGLLLNDDGTRVRFSASTGAAGSGRDATAPTALPLRTWTHIAAVMDGTTMRLLVNGTIVATGTAAGAPLSAPAIPLGVGVAYRDNGNTNFPSFPGYARHVRFWNVARTAAQIAASAAVDLPPDRAGLVAAWPLDETSGALARDVSGASRALTVPSGGIAAIRLGVLAAGPFFTSRTTAITDGSLQSLSDGHVIDFDSDGDLDLVVVQVFSPPTVPETRTRLRAFRNNNGTFVDVTDAVLGNVTMVHPRHGFVADFNRDGRVDLLIVGHGTDTPPFPGEQTKLLIQTADGRLADESAARLPQHGSFTHNVAAGDIDGDGDLDIYMANVNGGDSGPRFYLNNGSGSFTEATDRLPTDIANRTNGRNYTGSLLLDVDADGRVDLVLGPGDTNQNEILMNDGTGRFTRNSRFVLPPKILGDRSTTVSVATADFNGDGAPDLILGTTGGSEQLVDGRTIDGYGTPGLQLLLNRGDGTFYDATEGAGFTWSPAERWVIWTRLADFDADGRPDILAMVASTNYSGQLHRLFLNRGAGRFVDASEAYTSTENYTNFYHAGDFDRDGRIDILSANTSTVTLARGVKSIDRALFQTTADDLGRITNLSVRTQAGTGDQTLITGFALSGAGTKSLLVRAIGPTLSVFGLGGTLADPFMEIAPLGAANMATNDNWGGTAALKSSFGSVGAFPLSLDNSRDAALVFSPGAGAYTAKVTGIVGGTGLALVEVYDTGTGNTPRLTNVSARTQVGTGGDVLIVGFVVSGNVPKKLLIRAVGPTLGVFGVGGTLVDPVLELRPLGSTNIVATNDDWRGTAALKTAFTSVGAFAFAVDASKDAAIAIELPPGAYTATVTGKNNTTGVALIEVYDLPQ